MKKVLLGLAVGVLLLSNQAALAINTTKESTENQSPVCNQASLRDRVRCRLQLTNAELKKHRGSNYLPEECRLLRSGKQERCVERFSAIQTCWEKPVGSKRSKCAVEKLLTKSSAAAEVKQCKNLPGTDRKACENEAKERVEALIKFRLYDLAERSRAVVKNKTNLEVVATMVSALETNIQKLNQAATNKEKSKIITSTRNDWKKFVNKAKRKDLRNDYLDQALADLKQI